MNRKKGLSSFDVFDPANKRERERESDDDDDDSDDGFDDDVTLSSTSFLAGRRRRRRRSGAVRSDCIVVIVIVIDPSRFPSSSRGEERVSSSFTSSESFAFERRKMEKEARGVVPRGGDPLRTTTGALSMQRKRLPRTNSNDQKALKE